VNSVSPGWIPPNATVADGSVVDLANSLTPSSRNGDPKDVADAVFYLMNSSFQTGSDIAVD
jgi:NAD(P)-dependent dehydrogenase (short-subunit alcohol dehydrogenase family)